MKAIHNMKAIHIKAFLMLIALVLCFSTLGYVIYVGFFTPHVPRVVNIKGHEYIESGYRNTTMIHSESCTNKIHFK